MLSDDSRLALLAAGRVNALQRVPRSVLWLLQHPLDGNGGGGTEHAVPAFALSAVRWAACFSTRSAGT